jgi:hypothetical protein
LAAFQVLWFPTYLLGVLPTALAFLAAAAFAVGFVSTGFALKFTIEFPTGRPGTWGPDG